MLKLQKRISKSVPLQYSTAVNKSEVFTKLCGVIHAKLLRYPVSVVCAVR